MNRKETIAKHAVRKAVTILHSMLLSWVLLAGPGTCMTVQAVNEMQIQPENITEEVQKTIESEEIIQEENTESTVQMQTVSAEGTVQMQTVSAEGTMQMQTVNAEGVAQTQAAGTEGVEQTQAESTEDVGQMENEEENAQELFPPEAMSVTMIGDSVMLGAAPSLRELLPGCVIDAKVSRQVVHAGAIFDSLEEQNALGNTIVIALGTNGSFSVERGQKLIDRLGSGRTIYWVTVYGADLSWQEESNATIRALAANNANVHLIEWSQAASEHAEWLCADGIHLNTAGQTAYAGIVLAEILQNAV